MPQSYAENGLNGENLIIKNWRSQTNLQISDEMVYLVLKIQTG